MPIFYFEDFLLLLLSICCLLVLNMAWQDPNNWDIVLLIYLICFSVINGQLPLIYSSMLDWLFPSCVVRLSYPGCPSVCPQGLLLSAMCSWSIQSNGDLLLPSSISFLLSCGLFGDPSLNSQVPPFSLCCPVTSSSLLLTNSFKMGSKMYITKPVYICRCTHLEGNQILGFRT